VREAPRYPRGVPYFICPNCKERSIDIDAVEGLSDEPVACHACGFGFLFELMDDYYPAPATGLVTCDQEGRILALGRGVFELTGFHEQDILGRDVIEALGLTGYEETKNPVQLSLEWGVRRMGEQLELETRSGRTKPVKADFFPAFECSCASRDSTHACSSASAASALVSPRRSARAACSSIPPMIPSASSMANAFEDRFARASRSIAASRRRERACSARASSAACSPASMSA
jgi:hypothetical protein